MCRRIKFIHAYSEIVNILNTIHKAFNLNTNKLVGIIINNVLNFSKSFKIFESLENLRNICELEDQNDIEIIVINLSQISCTNKIWNINLPPKL